MNLATPNVPRRANSIVAVECSLTAGSFEDGCVRQNAASAPVDNISGAALTQIFPANHFDDEERQQEDIPKSKDP